MSKSRKIYPTVHYSEDKTVTTLIVTSGMPINEQEFIASVYDWLAEYKDKFNYEDHGCIVEFDMSIDDEYDGSPMH